MTATSPEVINQLRKSTRRGSSLARVAWTAGPPLFFYGACGFGFREIPTELPHPLGYTAPVFKGRSLCAHEHMLQKGGHADRS